MTKMNGPLRVGISGPVGAGKISLTAALARSLSKRFSVEVITNGIYNQADVEVLMRLQILPQDRIIGVETGGYPHTAIREDASINFVAVAELKKRHPEIEIVMIESGGDNLSATFSPELADLTVYVIDVAAGEEILHKGGPALTKSDILVINKTDLAPYVVANLEVMRRDASAQRGDKPFFFAQIKNDKGTADIEAYLLELAGV